MRKYVKEIKPHIVHSHRYKENLLAFTTANLNKGIKIIATQHGMPEIYEVRVPIERRMLTRFNFLLMKHAFDRIVCVSRDIKEKFVDNYGFVRSKCAVIQNGLKIPGVKERANIRGNFKIGTAGRLFPVKDYPLFVQIANSIIKQDKNVVFFLAGEGPEKEKLQKMVESFQISEKFIFLGHLDDMETFYSGLDLYLNTSMHEGIPMSVLEAMANGVPVIAANTGGLREIIEDQKNGFLINERNTESFAEKSLKILRNKGLRLALSRAARERIIRSFSAEKMAEGYYSLYRELLPNETSKKN
jgi:glycosyltransferase involved in cell wall biosynthesis